MNRNTIFLGLAAFLGVLGASSLPGRAGDGQLSPERLDVLDRLGYFTPSFKAAVHNLVDTKHALEEAKAEQAELAKEEPVLKRQATDAEASTDALRQELAKYDHPEEGDFVALQTLMNDSNAALADQIAQAQAYVWTYPASPHESDAQQFLQQAQKKLADQQQAEKDAAAARAAAHANLVQRALAHNLSITEWRDFLSDMSQDDLVKVLGRPTSQSGDYWIYSGGWVVDATTQQKVGMEINFNGGRVLSVLEQPQSP
jgi:hypothetical protein